MFCGSGYVKLRLRVGRGVDVEDKGLKIRCRWRKSRTVGIKVYSRVTNLADGQNPTYGSLHALY